MFLRRNFSKPHPHKLRGQPTSRLFQFPLTANPQSSSRLALSWAKTSPLMSFENFFISLGGGFLNTKVVSYFFTYSKKLLKLLKKSNKL
jgi:hypothetical protein